MVTSLMGFKKETTGFNHCTSFSSGGWPKFLSSSSCFPFSSVKGKVNCYLIYCGRHVAPLKREQMWMVTFEINSLMIK